MKSKSVLWFEGFFLILTLVLLTVKCFINPLIHITVVLGPIFAIGVIRSTVLTIIYFYRVVTSEKWKL